MLDADCCMCSGPSFYLPSSCTQPEGLAAAAAGRAVSLRCSKGSAGSTAPGSPQHSGSTEMAVSLKKVSPSLVNPRKLLKSSPALCQAHKNV